eukprot:Nk52_evm1s1964 gene=Nk52_evmTU1s1964
MGRLDASVLRYITRDEFRVLTAVEMGSKNHEIVPVALIASIAALPCGGAHKVLRNLSKHRLVYHDKKRYDGYRLTNLGYDYLALKTMVARGSIVGLGHQIGVGKESDIYICSDSEGRQLALKFHRLGRTSFKTSVKEKRDYLHNNKKQSSSWLYLSRMAAMKEYAYMKALFDAGYPVPQPVDYSRHLICMELVDGFPMSQLVKVADQEKLCSDLMNLILDLAELGLIHGDFNEFNLMTNELGKVTVIDFPQMVSVNHLNAEFYFNRDIKCVMDFFERKFNYKPDSFPTFEDIRPKKKKEETLDVILKVTGAVDFSELDSYIETTNTAEQEESESEEETSEEDEKTASDSDDGEETRSDEGNEADVRVGKYSLKRNEAEECVVNNIVDELPLKSLEIDGSIAAVEGKEEQEEGVKESEEVEEAETIVIKSAEADSSDATNGEMIGVQNEKNEEDEEEEVERYSDDERLGRGFEISNGIEENDNGKFRAYRDSSTTQKSKNPLKTYISPEDIRNMVKKKRAGKARKQEQTKALNSKRSNVQKTRDRKKNQEVCRAGGRDDF